MSKGSRVREVLEKLKDDCLFRQTEFYKDTNICQDVCRDAYGYVDQALSDLAEIVRGLQKNMTGEYMTDCLYRPPLLDGQKVAEHTHVNYEQRRGYNQAITDIAKLFEAKD